MLGDLLAFSASHSPGPFFWAGGNSVVLIYCMLVLGAAQIIFCPSLCRIMPCCWVKPWCSLSQSVSANLQGETLPEFQKWSLQKPSAFPPSTYPTSPLWVESGEEKWDGLPYLSFSQNSPLGWASLFLLLLTPELLSIKLCDQAGFQYANKRGKGI